MVYPDVYRKIREVVWKKLEPMNKSVLWALPGDNSETFSFFAYDNGTWVPLSAGSNVTKLSELENDVGFITNDDLPSFADVATSGSYNDLLNLPDLFSGSFGDLSNTPTTLSGYGITDASISNGTITLGSNTITPLTSHQSLTDYIQKSTTSGLVKNDGTIDTNTYLTQHQDISNYVQKSQTAGLLKNDGTVDTSTYLTSAHEVPAGGNAGQILAKTSATDYDVHWTNQTITYPSAYCTTAAGTAAKKASCTLYALQANSYVHVLIGLSNTSASALTLTINSTTAKPIYINGTASSATNYTLPAGTYIVFYDGTAYQFRTDGQLPGLGSVVKEDRVVVDTISGTTLTAAVGKYYVGSSVGTLAITLPTVSDTTHIANVVLNIATGSSPAVTFAAGTGVIISYSKDFALEASKEYEVNCLWNGAKWIIMGQEVETPS